MQCSLYIVCLLLFAEAVSWLETLQGAGRLSLFLYICTVVIDLIGHHCATSILFVSTLPHFVHLKDKKLFPFVLYGFVCECACGSEIHNKATEWTSVVWILSYIPFALPPIEL